MSYVKLELFTSPTCPNCPSAEKLVKEISKEYEDLKVSYFSTATGRGRKKAKNYGIQSVPTIIITSDNFSEIRAIRGTPRKIHLENIIREGFGLDTLKEEKKGILSRIFGKN